MWERYEIGQLILEAMERRGMTRQELIQRLGYTNFSKGFRKVDAAIRGGDGDRIMLERIGEVLDISPREIETALTATRNRQVQSVIQSIIPKLRR